VAKNREVKQLSLQLIFELKTGHAGFSSSQKLDFRNGSDILPDHLLILNTTKEVEKLK
jgi:hypothetical protein